MNHRNIVIKKKPENRVVKINLNFEFKLTGGGPFCDRQNSFFFLLVPNKYTHKATIYLLSAILIYILYLFLFYLRRAIYSLGAMAAMHTPPVEREREREIRVGGGLRGGRAKSEKDRQMSPNHKYSHQ